MTVPSARQGSRAERSRVDSTHTRRADYGIGAGNVVQLHPPHGHRRRRASDLYVSPAVGLDLDRSRGGSLVALLSQVGSPSHRRPSPHAPCPRRRLQERGRVERGGRSRRGVIPTSHRLRLGALWGSLGRARPRARPPPTGAAVLPTLESRHICHFATSQSLGCEHRCGVADVADAPICPPTDAPGWAKSTIFCNRAS